MSKYFLLPLILGITNQGSAQTLAPWTFGSGTFKSISSKLKIYVPATLNANLGESVLIIASLDSTGQYIGKCEQYIYKGVQMDSFIIEKISYFVTSSQPASFGRVGDLIQNNPNDGYPLLLANCFLTNPKESTVYYIPKTWSRLPINLEGLTVNLMLQPDFKLSGNVTIQR